MPKPPSFQRLREAVEMERSQEMERLQRYSSFLEKVDIYQQGVGSLPGEQEFLQWREDLRRAIAFSELVATASRPPARHAVNEVTVLCPALQTHQAQPDRRSKNQSSPDPHGAAPSSAAK
jgi:hypothetical protein